MFTIAPILAFLFLILRVVNFLLSVSQFSRSVMSDSLRPHGLQHHATLPCPSPTAGAHSNSYPLSRWSIQPSHPLSSPYLLTFNLSQHQDLFKWSVLRIRRPKYWSFSFSISPSNEYSGLISFRIDWFDLLAVKETLKGLLQHHSSKASILLPSALYHPTLTSIHDYWKSHSFD